MRVQFEKTDTFAGEANYSWVKRETLVLPDDTPDRMVVALARRWAGYTGRGSEWEKMGGNDDIRIKPHGRLEVVFVTFDYDPQNIGVGDLVQWAEDIVAALLTEDRNRVTPAEKAYANAIMQAHAFIDGKPQQTFVPTGDDLTRAMHQRDNHRGA